MNGLKRESIEYLSKISHVCTLHFTKWTSLRVTSVNRWKVDVNIITHGDSSCTAPRDPINT